MAKRLKLKQKEKKNQLPRVAPTVEDFNKEYEDNLEEIHKEMNTSVVTMFLLSDMLETSILNTYTMFKKYGIHFKDNIREKMEKLTHQIRKIREHTISMPVDKQAEIGDVSDEMFDLIMEVYKYTQGYPEYIKKITDEVREFREKLEAKENE